MKTKKLQPMKMQLLLLMIIISVSAQAQHWRLGGNSNLPAVDDITAVGANSFGSKLTFNVPINFITNGVQRMTILAGLPGGPTTGFVGIGNSGSALNPLWQLDVNDNANLNIAYLTNPGFGYRINGNKILSNPGTKNIFVGNGAGTGWSSLSPINYTQAKAVFF